MNDSTATAIYAAGSAISPWFPDIGSLVEQTPTVYDSAASGLTNVVKDIALAGFINVIVLLLLLWAAVAILDSKAVSNLVRAL
jgi:hypothetical protein